MEPFPVTGKAWAARFGRGCGRGVLSVVGSANLLAICCPLSSAIKYDDTYVGVYLVGVFLACPTRKMKLEESDLDLFYVISSVRTLLASRRWFTWTCILFSLK